MKQTKRLRRYPLPPKKGLRDESSERREDCRRGCLRLGFSQKLRRAEKKQTVLEGKIEAIEDMLGRAVDVLKALPKREYFEMLKELAVKNAISGDGVMRFSKDDTAKLPQNFISNVNSALSGKGSVSLGEPCDIDSGFMLVYGDIDVNCTFSSLVSEKRDELFDELNKLLFN